MFALPSEMAMLGRSAKNMKSIGIIAFTIITVLSLPIVLPVMVIRNIIDGRTQKRIANSVKCEECGQTLGVAAILESNRRIAEEWKEVQAKYPDSKFLRGRRRHDAICTTCHKEYYYSDQGKTYLLVATS